MIVKRFLIGIAAALIALSAVASAQTTGTYRLQIDDVIRIQIYQDAAVNTVVIVGKDGNITAPFIGPMRAVGKTVSELEAELKTEYIRVLKLRDPILSVTIERYRQIRASIGGFVVRPGVYDIRDGDTILTLLNYAGGQVLDGRANLRRATLRRKDGRETIPIDLHAMLVLGDTSQNYTLQDGDELLIPEDLRGQIAVLGTVAQPGIYGYRENMRLIDAISAARGEVRGRSRLSRVQVVRERPGAPGQYIRIQADLVRFLKLGDQTQNILLQRGDIIVVPEVDTPDLNFISGIANTLYIVQLALGGDFLGFRLLGR